MKKILIVLFIQLVIISAFAYGNDDLSNVIWISPKEGETFEGILSKTSVGDIFLNHNVISYYQALPWSKEPQLLNIYEIICEKSIDAKHLVNKLESKYLSYFSSIKHIPNPISVGTYNPSDYMWETHPDWMWHLKIIDADKAWFITKGSPDVKIAIIDS